MIRLEGCILPLCITVKFLSLMPNIIGNLLPSLLPSLHLKMYLFLTLPPIYLWTSLPQRVVEASSFQRFRVEEAAFLKEQANWDLVQMRLMIDHNHNEKQNSRRPGGLLLLKFPCILMFLHVSKSNQNRTQQRT